VLIDEEEGIIAGHGRVRAAHVLGLDEVPCIVLAHLTPAQRRAYVLADNKLALNAGWDLEMLSLEIGELGEAGFDLSLTGFDEFELGERVDPVRRKAGRLAIKVGREASGSDH
jgi:ParB-like chromosome segregation protein Spo0J